MLFGYVFLDLNAVLETQAVSIVMALSSPWSVPGTYRRNRVSMTGSDLDGLTRTGPAMRCFAEGRRLWLEFWRSGAGLDGFNPVDLKAAAPRVRPGAHWICPLDNVGGGRRAAAMVRRRSRAAGTHQAGLQVLCNCYRTGALLQCRDCPG